jgi:Bifunctional DNA primase/polymerase, N-terminal
MGRHDMSMSETDSIHTGIEEAAAPAAASKSANSGAAQHPGVTAGQADNHVSETLKAAQSYIGAGWKTFPGKRRGKEPTTGWSWKKRHLAFVEAPAYFDKDQHNVLVVLGSISGNLIDIDLDWPEAAEAADLVFNDLPSFGRGGKLRSHRLARCVDIKSKKYSLPQSLAGHSKVVEQPEHMMCVAEIRGGGAYTVFPGSEHTTGQKIEWTDADVDHAASMPDIEPHILLSKMGLSVFVAFCMRFYPAVGTRCDFMMAVAGALARAGYDAKTIQQTVQRIGDFNGDNGDRGSWSVAANTSTTGSTKARKSPGSQH